MWLARSKGSWMYCIMSFGTMDGGHWQEASLS